MTSVDTSYNSVPYDNFEDVNSYLRPPGIPHHQKMRDLTNTYEDLEEESEDFNRRKANAASVANPINNPILKTSSEVKHFEISASAIGSAKVNEILKSKASADELKESDIEKEFNEAMTLQKNAQNELVIDLYNQIRITMKANKDLHVDLDAIRKRIEEEAKTSEKLKWVSKGSGVALAAYTVIAVSLTLATGGTLGVIFGLIGAVAGAAQGTMSVANTIRQMQARERQGEAAVIDQSRVLGNDNIHKYLSESHTSIQQWHRHALLQTQILQEYMRAVQAIIRG